MACKHGYPDVCP
ncbi:hypothetical protein, partial [cardiovirus B2]